ncbi:hypothetical protein Tco_0572870 [Tanacetum coccineum]
MANQEQNPPQQEQPFVATKQVGFNLEDIILNTNNEVALLYPEHNNKDHFKCVSDFISKCCLRKSFTRSRNLNKDNVINKISQWRLKFPSPLSMLRGFPKAQSLELNMDTRSTQLLQNNHLCPTKRQQKQAISGPTSFGVTNEARANPQLSSGISAFNLNKPIYSASFIIHSESASRNDASIASIAKADPGNSAPSDFVPQQQGMETVLTQPITGKGAISVSRQIKEETSSTIKLEDLAKLVSHVQPSFKDMDSPEDDPVIVMNDSDEDEDDEVHATKNVETEDTSVPKSLSPRSSQIKELTDQVLILQSQKHKLELKKNKAEAEAALLKAQPSFSNVEQLKELLVKYLKTEFSNILSAHDFSNSLPTKLKDLPSKLNELTREVKGLNKQVHELEIELPGDLKEIPTKLDDFTKNVTSLTSQVAELKNL